MHSARWVQFIHASFDTQGISGVPSFAVCPADFFLLRVATVPTPLIIRDGRAMLQALP
jgi:hypothetical protein